VSSLTEDGSSELSEELMKNQSVVHDDNFHNEDDVEDWENWHPDPVDADPGLQLITSHCHLSSHFRQCSRP